MKISDEIKRYWLFGGLGYYPDGGMLDFKESAAVVDALKRYFHENDHLEWAHIYDLKDEKIIMYAYRDWKDNSYEWFDHENT